MGSEVDDLCPKTQNGRANLLFMSMTIMHP
jgi:hypothetical protein